MRMFPVALVSTQACGREQVCWPSRQQHARLMRVHIQKVPLFRGITSLPGCGEARLAKCAPLHTSPLLVKDMQGQRARTALKHSKRR